MQAKLKHRLIGLAVIIVSSAILLPLVFKGEGYKARHGDSIVPPMPEMPAPVDIYPTAKRLPDTSNIAPISQQSAQQSSQEGSPAKEQVVIVPVPQIKEIEKKHTPAIDFNHGTPELDTQNVSVAWSLQLATFSNEGNARELKDKLVADGHKVYLRKEGQLVKVFVGPDLQKGKLQALKKQLDKDFRLQSIIIRFSPN